MPIKLFYLHGFNSSPEALKAQEVQGYIDAHSLDVDYIRPWIPDTPDKAIPFLEDLIETNLDNDIRLIGSSLGGFYATWLTLKYSLKAVLINPAVRPHELMHKYLGDNTNPYSGQHYLIEDRHMQDLAAIYPSSISEPERFLVLLQMADEVLDAKEASQRFHECSCIIEPAGDHRFEHFERFLPSIMHWLDLE